MFHQRTIRLDRTVAVLLCGVLSACGSGGSGSGPDSVNPPNENPTNVSGDEAPTPQPSMASDDESGGAPSSMPSSSGGEGIDLVSAIFVQHTSTPEETNTRITANFLRLEEAVPADFPVQVLPDRDRCGPGSMETLGVDFTQGVALSAGEVITINSQNGSFARLIPQPIDEDADMDYESGDIGQAPFDLDLTISIPGDEFPQVDSLLLPNQAAFDETMTDQLRRVTSNPTLRWMVNQTPDGSTGLVALTAASVGVESSTVNVLSCIVLDDGEFTVPTDVLGGLGDKFNPTIVSVLHLRVSKQVINGAGFIITQTHLQ